MSFPFLKNRAAISASVFCGIVVVILLIVHFNLPDDAREAINLRLAEGKRPRTVEHALTVTWWTTVLGAALMAAAAATARWWAGSFQASSLPAARTVPRWSKAFWLAVLLILIVAGGLRAKRLDLGLYNDEAYSFRRHMAGEFRDNPKTGELEFRRPTWVNTLWFSEVGNNSPPYSITARICYETAAKAVPLAEGEVLEWPLRLPAWLAGMAGIFMTGLVARSLGTVDRGLIAMGLTALHPWHIRYSSEARGHSFLLFLLPLLVWAIGRALQRGTWKGWLLAGLVQMLTMWTFPGALHPLLAVNVALALWFGAGWMRRTMDRGTLYIQCQRWLFSTLFGALLFVVVYGPAANQMRMTLGEVESLHSHIPWSWWLNIGALMLSGQPWHDANAESPYSHALLRSWQEGHALPSAGFLLLLCLTLAGLFWTLRRGVSGGVIVAAAIPALILAFFVSKLTGTVLHEWYTLASLPFVIVLAGAAANLTSRSQTSLRLFGLGGVTCCLIAWVISIQPALSIQLTHGVQPLRETVELVRGDIYPRYKKPPAEQIFAAFWADIAIYDPELIVLKDIDQLRRLAENAASSGRELWVSFAHRDLAMHSYAALIHELESSGKYERIADLQGFGAAQFNHHVFKMRH